MNFVDCASGQRWQSFDESDPLSIILYTLQLQLHYALKSWVHIQFLFRRSNAGSGSQVFLGLLRYLWLERRSQWHRWHDIMFCHTFKRFIISGLFGDKLSIHEILFIWIDTKMSRILLIHVSLVIRFSWDLQRWINKKEVYSQNIHNKWI